MGKKRRTVVVAAGVALMALGCSKPSFRTADADAIDLGAEAAPDAAPDAPPPDAPPDAMDERPDASAPDADAGTPDAAAADAGTPDVADADEGAPDADVLDADVGADGGCLAGRRSVLGRCVVTSSDPFALGAGHSCAKGTAGSCGGAYCWGSNRYCALGIRDDIDAGVSGCSDDGGIDPRGVNCMPFGFHPPTRVSLPGEVLQFTAGSDHTCALVDDSVTHGTVYCWGTNTYGQVGDCSSTNRPAPVRVTLPRRAVQVVAGFGHTCALLDDGVPWCWGRNDYGQAGRVGGSQYLPRPINPGLDGTVSQIALGGQSTCALMSGDGSVVCWGRNDHGEFGRPASLAEGGSNRLPAEGVEDVVQVAVGEAFVCALRRDGQVLCWGGNEECELGAPVVTSPVRRAQIVPGLTDVRQISAQYRHACALVGAGGAVWCWGLATSAQTGPMASPTNCVTGRDGGATNYVTAAPTRMTELPSGGAVAVSASFQHSCALMRSGALYCWGGNTNAELGSGTSGGGSALPVRVTVCPPDGGDGGTDAADAPAG